MQGIDFYALVIKNHCVVNRIVKYPRFVYLSGYLFVVKFFRL